MENNVDLILAQLHMEEEELLLLAGLAFAYNLNKESLEDADSVVKEDGGLNPISRGGHSFDSMKICWSNCRGKKEKITKISHCTFVLFVESRTWLPPSCWKNALDSDHLTKYLRRTKVVFSSYYNRSKSYYSLNEQCDYSTISKFKNDYECMRR